MTGIREAIRKMAKDNDFDATNATVVSVNKADDTCEVKISSGEVIPNARLRAIIVGADHVVVYPKVHTEESPSEVSLLFLDNDLKSALVISVSNPEETILMGDSFGGLIKIAALVERLNNIEQAYNELAGKWNSFCSTYVPGSPTTPGLPASLAIETVEEVLETGRSQLENGRVKHG